jgi:hypothetical protein
MRPVILLLLEVDCTLNHVYASDGAGEISPQNLRPGGMGVRVFKGNFWRFISLNSI